MSVGRGFSWRDLYLMRRLFEAYPNILQTLSAKSVDTASPEIQSPPEPVLAGKLSTKCISTICLTKSWPMSISWRSPTKNS